MLLANYVASVDLVELEKENDGREEKQRGVKTSVLASVAVKHDDTKILLSNKNMLFNRR